MRPVYATQSKIWDEIEELEKVYNISNLSNEEYKKLVEHRAKLENSFYEFIKESWMTVEGPQRPFYDNWHIKAIADHLQATYDQSILDLLINIPPRCGKSTIVGVMFPAWAWCKNPNLRFLYSSHAQNLALRDSVNCRSLIASDWYQKLWGHKVKLRRDANSKRRFYNTAGGFRMVTSVTGSTIGEGGDYVICDDPNSRESVDSALQRERTNLWWDGTMSTRVANPKTTVKIIIQQRLHERDLSGHVLSKEDADNWTHLCLPMEFEEERRCTTIKFPYTKTKRWTDPRKKEGELLWPSLWGVPEVEKKKRELNSAYYISGQLQQRPTPVGGNIIKGEWFNWWTEASLPKCEYIIQSWDTALSTGPDACYSAVTTWGVFYYGVEEGMHLEIPQVILLSAWRGRVEFPDLRKMAKRLAHNYHDIFPDEEPMGWPAQPHTILVETKANGESLLQELRRAGVMATAFNPSQQGTNFGSTNSKYSSKVSRARLATSLIEGGRVWLPARAPHFQKLKPFAEMFLEACNTFPMKESNDLVDSMSQAFIKIMKSGMVYHPEDEVPLPPEKPWENSRKIY